MISLKIRFLSFALFVFSAAVLASVMSPDTLVKQVTTDVLSVLRSDPSIQAGSANAAATLIEEKVAPHFDFDRMTALALGRNWRNASSQQQKMLVKEFRLLLIRTYAKTLIAYKNQTVHFDPFRGKSGDDEATVKSRIDQPGARPISLTYRLGRVDETWKVFDVAVDNASLVTNYRASFNQEVKTAGVDGLIKALRKKNGSG